MGNNYVSEKEKNSRKVFSRGGLRRVRRYICKDLSIRFLNVYLLEMTRDSNLSKLVDLYLADLFCLKGNLAQLVVTGGSDNSNMRKAAQRFACLDRDWLNSHFFLQINTPVKMSTRSMLTMTVLKSLALLNRLFYKQRKPQFGSFTSTRFIKFTSFGDINKINVRQQLHHGPENKNSQQIFRLVVNRIPNSFSILKSLFFIILPLVWRKNLVTKFMLRKSSKNESTCDRTLGLYIKDIPQVISYLNVDLLYDYFDWEDATVSCSLELCNSDNINAIQQSVSTVTSAMRFFTMCYVSSFRII